MRFGMGAGFCQGSTHTPTPRRHPQRRRGRRVVAGRSAKSACLDLANLPIDFLTALAVDKLDFYFTAGFLSTRGAQNRSQNIKVGFLWGDFCFCRVELCRTLANCVCGWKNGLKTGKMTNNNKKKNPFFVHFPPFFCKKKPFFFVHFSPFFYKKTLFLCIFPLFSTQKACQQTAKSDFSLPTLPKNPKKKIAKRGVFYPAQRPSLPQRRQKILSSSCDHKKVILARVITLFRGAAFTRLYSNNCKPRRLYSSYCTITAYANV
jgi:hypothetical protein